MPLTHKYVYDHSTDKKSKLSKLKYCTRYKSNYSTNIIKKINER